MSFQAPPRAQKWIAPNDFEYLCIVFLIRFAPRFSHAWIANLLAWFAFHFSRAKRRAMEQNLARVFGETCDARQIENIARDSLRAFWESMLAWALPPLDELAPKIELRGIEHLRAGLARGNGVILWESNGLSERILAKRILQAHDFTLYQIHGANHLGGFLANGHPFTRARAWTKDFFDARAAHFIGKLIYLPPTESLAFTRLLLVSLRENAILCAAGDGREGHKLVRTEFLGQTAPFATGMVSLARLADAPILPLFCWRAKAGAVHLRIDPPLSHAHALTEYAQALEREIRQRPHTYMNWHSVNE